MRRSVLSCFDDFVPSTTAVYTANQYNDTLGAFDKLAIQAVVTQVAGTSPTLTVAIEHSNDQRNWVAKNTTAEINAQALTAGATTTLVGTDAGTTPSLGYVRLKITLGGTGSPAAQIRLAVCMRDDA